MKRRSVLKCLGCTAAATVGIQTDLIPLLGGIENVCAFEGTTTRLSSKEASHYQLLPGGGIECGICPRHCQITDLERGYCGVRENRDDKYFSLVYGLPCSANIDPVEKKPLYHFMPGSRAFSLATAGCNVNCKFCQNWEISQTRPEQTINFELSPKAAVDICINRKIPIIAYTYTEPVVFYEYMRDIARLGQQRGVKSVMITGGYIEKEPLRELLPSLDAVKIDLKAIREDYYRDIVDGELQPVLDALLQIKESGTWLEIVYLVVPTLNDSDNEFHELAKWIIKYLGPDVPVHFSRFYPQYLLKDLPPTPVSTINRAMAIGRSEGLRFVYPGNVRGHREESTVCPNCGKVVIERQGYNIKKISLSGNKCQHCKYTLPGVFQ